MVKQAIPLDMISVASPCPVAWDDMRGDERVRYCGQCRNHVYDLSTLTRIQAERLISETEGKVCVRFFRRDDGTVMTRDCPKARERLRRLIALAAALVAAGMYFLTGAVASLMAIGLPSSNSPSNGFDAWQTINSQVNAVRNWLTPPPPPPPPSPPTGPTMGMPELKLPPPAKDEQN